VIRRSRRSLPASLVALVLLAACVVVAVSAIQFLVGERPLVGYTSLTDAIHRTNWDQWPVLLGGGVAVVLGLVLLYAAVVPGKAIVLPLAPTGENIDSGATRQSLRRTLRTAVSSVDGVDTTKLKQGRKKVTARVRTNRTNTEGIAEAVRSAVELRLDQIAPVIRPSVRVRLKSVRSRA
jgi:hypothetical protein